MLLSAAAAAGASGCGDGAPASPGFSPSTLVGGNSGAATPASSAVSSAAPPPGPANEPPPASIVASSPANSSAVGSFGGEASAPPGAPSPAQDAAAPDAVVGATPVPPPPISGGTLLLLGDGHTVAASDPDRDLVYVVDTSGSMALKASIAVSAGDEPGRLAQDGAGRVHVALRSGGAVVTIDPNTATIVDRRSVCPAPRGLAWDGSTDTVWVACATGELVGLPAAGGGPTALWVVERDLRDVLVSSGQLLVSKYRSAEILHVSTTDGTVVSRDAMPLIAPALPHMAWRTTWCGSNGRTVTLHQEHSQRSIPTMQPGAYTSSGGAVSEAGSTGPGSIVTPHCTVHDADGTLVSTLALSSALAFDVAATPDCSHVAVVGPGGPTSATPAIELTAVDGSTDEGMSYDVWVGAGGGEATAVVFDAAGNLVVQTREPAALWVVPASFDMSLAKFLSLSSVSRDDPGHDLFHEPTEGNIACVSCHGEGGDDGHVWTFDTQLRRTPSLRGTIAGTAPYHWAGDEIDFPTLANDVFTNRMSGSSLSSQQTAQLGQWVESIPPPPAPSWVDAASASRGAVLFATPSIGCSTCHSGPKFTNNLTLDVGTGQPFQVPPLIGVGWRTPLLHDGCAATIADRFGSCATTGHGVTLSLTTQDTADLINYLEQL